MRLLASAVLAALVCAPEVPVRADSPPRVEIPQDRSLSVEQYVARGLPDLHDAWGPAETARATCSPSSPPRILRSFREREAIVPERCSSECWPRA